MKKILLILFLLLFPIKSSTDTKHYIFNLKREQAYVILLKGAQGNISRYGPYHNWFTESITFVIGTTQPYLIRIVNVEDSIITRVVERDVINAPLIFPNPSNGMIFVPCDIPGEIIFFSVKGERLFEREVGNTLNIVSLPFPSGTYFYKILYNTGQNFTGQIVIVK